MNIGNSIALDFTGFEYSKNSYIRAKVLRNISLKFHNSFGVKLFVYEGTFSIAETFLLHV